MKQEGQGVVLVTKSPWLPSCFFSVSFELLFSLHRVCPERGTRQAQCPHSRAPRTTATSRAPPLSLKVLSLLFYLEEESVKDGC